MFYVYLLESKDKFYIGFTDNLKRRVKEHNAGQSVSTKAHRPWRLIFYEAYADKDDALRREGYLKTSQGKRALRRMITAYSQKTERYFDY